MRAGLILAALVLLHRLDGGEVLVNPAQVTSLHARSGVPNKLIAGQAHCTLWLSDGRMVSVWETCPVVKDLMEGGPDAR